MGLTLAWRLGRVQDPRMGQTIQVRVLRRAAALTGGTRALSRALRVDHDLFFRWMQDELVPPIRVFLRAIEIMVLNDCHVYGPAEAAHRLGRDLTSSLPSVD